ncbi:TlpA disulfide reductase family protein [uncultured Dokdonia sp.]|uniref:TlpA family protein disulfide reductase n=1 Tax=uncultured Dokdonia sp. TaxID=575653 RepID=UPI00261CA6B2|nr:TlpA disulfide reductase family protein [uncultured Dokdonia sp.]
MKYYLFFIVLGMCQLSVGQETYYNFQDEIFNEVRFREKLTSIETLYGDQSNYTYTTASYKVRATKVRQDSIIQEVEVILSQSNTAPLDINTGVQRFINKPLPDFELQDLESHLKTNSDYTGKVTLINLWFTACPPCITEIPYLNYLKDSYKDQVNFVAITFDSKDKVDRFLSRKAFDFEHLVAATTYLHKQLNNNAFPKLILIDKRGQVRFVENGVLLSGNIISQPEAAVSGLKEQLDFLLNEQL